MIIYEELISKPKHPWFEDKNKVAHCCEKDKTDHLGLTCHSKCYRHGAVFSGSLDYGHILPL